MPTCLGLVAQHNYQVFSNSFKVLVRPEAGGPASTSPPHRAAKFLKFNSSIYKLIIRSPLTEGMAGKIHGRNVPQAGWFSDG